MENCVFYGVSSTQRSKEIQGLLIVDLFQFWKMLCVRNLVAKKAVFFSFSDKNNVFSKISKHNKGLGIFVDKKKKVKDGNNGREQKEKKTISIITSSVLD